MKKVLAFFIAAIAVVAVSCQKNVEDSRHQYDEDPYQDLRHIENQAASSLFIHDQDKDKHFARIAEG